MSKDIWINLPVKDVEESTSFFNSIGLQAMNVGNVRAQISIGQTKILLFPIETFEKFTDSKATELRVEK
ncbi:hypothetical protein GCM10008014_38220 [Paenibacillus silvae]|uniref:Glyoxalase/fosfomycin resistance/dioxygenase domain-containing protein n=1 Tax=Paenibacillus silvae TaxID=1325358 RepID=A0ABQ1ZHN8_9BACL|nr:hypothetical protein [Paenibacillus silvae]GGH62105.1 hypothetical protein GCM10008014_38220 [Paenibacillus silvae]